MKPLFKLAGMAAMFCLGLVFSASAQIQIGKTNFLPYLDEVPPPSPSLNDAARMAYGSNVMQPDARALERAFQPIRDKVDRAQEQYRQAFAGKYQLAGMEEQAYAQVKANVNDNPIVSRMGGVDNVRQMSQQEAEASARQAAAAYQQDIMQSTMGGNTDMAALYQKMLSDPAYRERFDKMSDGEKAAVLQQYMGPASSNNITPMTSEQMARQQQTLKARDKVTDAMEVNAEITRIYQMLEDARAAYGLALEARKAAAQSHQQIDAEYARKYNAIPEIIAGEAGRQKDPVQFRQLQLSTAEAHREQAARNLKYYSGLYEELKQQYKAAITAYTGYMAQNSHKVNGDINGLYDGTNTELAVLNFELGLLGLAKGLAEVSEEVLSEEAYWEKFYQETQATYSGR